MSRRGGGSIANPLSVGNTIPRAGGIANPLSVGKTTKRVGGSPGPSLVSHWPCNESSGTIVNDLVGNNNLVQGNGTITWANPGVRHNGSGELWIWKTPSVSVPTYMQSRTVSFFGKIPEDDGSGSVNSISLLSYANSGYAAINCLRQRASTVVYADDNGAGAGNTVNAPDVPPLGVWVHYAYTFTKSTKMFRFYQNGVLQVSQVLTIYTPVAPVNPFHTLGMSLIRLTEMRDVRLYSTVQSASTIAGLAGI